MRLLVTRRLPDRVIEAAAARFDLVLRAPPGLRGDHHLRHRR